MSKPMWTQYQVTSMPDNERICTFSVSGSASQRRKSVRKKIDQLRRGQEICVRKFSWPKGESPGVHSIRWDRIFPAK